MNKYLIYVFLFSCSTLFGQSPRHEFTPYVSGVYAKLNYGEAVWDSKIRPQVNFGIDYRYYLSTKWSLGTGVGIQFYSSDLKLSSLKSSYGATDTEGDDFEFRYQGTGYVEKQTLRYVEVPLNLQYENGGDKGKWFVNLGGKAAFNLSSFYTVDISSLETKGYYQQWNVELLQPAFAGFGEWRNVSQSRKELDRKMVLFLSAETGLKSTVLGLPLRISVFADYGLNNAMGTTVLGNPVEYHVSNPSDFSYTGITGDTGKQMGTFDGSLKLFNVGVKLGFVIRGKAENSEIVL